MSLFNPQLFILSAPSGTGKSTIFQWAGRILPKLALSVSHTTRDPRPGEVDAVHYHFTTKTHFKAMIQDQGFLEWAEVFGNYYGTSKSAIQAALDTGKAVVLDIDVQGATQLMQIKGVDAYYLFIAPPSLDCLAQRLKDRGTESQQSLERRLGQAEDELAFQERYDHVIINNQLDQAVDDFIRVVLKRCLDLDQLQRIGIDAACAELSRPLEGQDKASAQVRLKAILKSL